MSIRKALIGLGTAVYSGARAGVFGENRIILSERRETVDGKPSQELTYAGIRVDTFVLFDVGGCYKDDWIYDKTYYPETYYSIRPLVIEHRPLDTSNKKRYTSPINIRDYFNKMFKK